MRNQLQQERKKYASFGKQKNKTKQTSSAATKE